MEGEDTPQVDQEDVYKRLEQGTESLLPKSTCSGLPTPRLPLPMSEVETKPSSAEQIEMVDENKVGISGDVPQVATNQYADIYYKALEKYGEDGSIPKDAEKKLKRSVMRTSHCFSRLSPDRRIVNSICAFSRSWASATSST